MAVLQVSANGLGTIPPSPPASLNRRETAPPFAAKYAKMPVFRNISSPKRTGENGLAGIEWRQSAGLSLDGTCARPFAVCKLSILRADRDRRGYLKIG